MEQTKEDNTGIEISQEELFQSMNQLLSSAITDLKSGNLYEGFKKYEGRILHQTSRHVYVPLSYPRWQGETFSGKKLLVYREQGLGDTLQFMRYLGFVKSRGGHVTFLPPHSLRRIAKKSLHAVVDCVADEIRLRDFDLFIPLLSLPMIFGTTLHTIPNRVPYIELEPEWVDQWKPYIRPERVCKIGFVWSGKKNTILNRSCELSDFYPLFRVKNTAFYSLQVGEEASDLKKLPADFTVTDLSGQIQDFADTAGAIANLDLIISIDTSVPHLSGAMGKPTWLVLPKLNEWRWLRDREDSPWYPTIKLYRQRTEGKWGPVFAKMADDLDRIINRNFERVARE
ncbi:MAG: hypothetical protein E6713_00945 [Sporomusaceae bacterium]|nr:hypothetical protein [Sporomusaceae bacterium]